MIKEVLKNLFQKLFAPEERQPEIYYFEKAEEGLESALKSDIIKNSNEY